jgi:hypothetical protein
MIDRKARAASAFGAATIAFWISTAVFPTLIPPLASLPDLSGLLAGIAPWIRRLEPSMSRPDADVLASLRREMITILLVSWLYITLGVASGVLIARRKSVGRWLGIALCTWLLARFVLAQGHLVVVRRFVPYWTAMAKIMPRHFASTVLHVAFYAATVALLMRRSAAAWFNASSQGKERDPA